MRVLDLFSGLEGWSSAFAARGHEVVTVDIEEKFNPTVVANLLDVDLTSIVALGPFDVVLASPPCTAFSVASIGRHWGGGHRAYLPKTQAAMDGMNLVSRTVQLIEMINPKLAVIENPRGVLRKLNLLPYERHTITFCQYGETRMKPTDLWVRGQQPALHPMCKNGAPCHERAPRGAKTGTQGIKNAALRAVIPYELSATIADHAESLP